MMKQNNPFSFTCDELIILEKAVRNYIRDEVSRDYTKSMLSRFKMCCDLIKSFSDAQTQMDFDIFDKDL